MDRTEWEQDKALDPLQLDIEAARQSDVFYKWAKRSAEAKTEVAIAKFEMDIVQARLQLACRSNPKLFGLERVTEAAITAAVTCHEERIASEKAYIAAKRIQYLMAEAVDTLQQKKAMIEALIKLHGQQYFAGPSVPRDIVAAWSEYQESVEERVAKRQARVARKCKMKQGSKTTTKRGVSRERG